LTTTIGLAIQFAEKQYTAKSKHKSSTNMNQKKWIRSLLTLSLVVVASLVFSPTATGADPLPSWNNGPAKTAIIEFVEAVTQEGDKDYVAPAVAGAIPLTQKRRSPIDSQKLSSTSDRATLLLRTLLPSISFSEFIRWKLRESALSAKVHRTNIQSRRSNDVKSRHFNLRYGRFHDTVWLLREPFGGGPVATSGVLPL
jgi:hypothetical protein